MKTKSTFPKFKALALSVLMSLGSLTLNAQTNVYDDIIATSPNHTSLAAAINAAGLQSALQNPAATLTVFAPTNDAIDDLADALGTDIAGILASPELSDILLYHVLGITAESGDINNGDIVTPLNTDNTIKITKTSGGMVYVNQAMVNAPDLMADNGVVHSIDAVILSVETVADIAIDNGFTSLVTAVVTAELLPALTDPFAEFTVFAPTNDAFDDVASALGTDLSGLLALPNLSDILLYHVLGVIAESGDISNGDLVTPLNAANTIKITKTGSGEVYVNQAMVSLADLNADNGVVHVIDAVILPAETVADIAIDNGFTTLVTAVVTAELLPALTNPFAELTVFAPTNDAFDDLATSLGTDLNGILALPNLADVLLYHVIGSTVVSTDLVNGPVETLNGEDVLVNLSMGVMINSSTVTTPDIMAENGVVHVIDRVLLPNTNSINELSNNDVSIFPNPVSEIMSVNVSNDQIKSLKIFSNEGKVVYESTPFSSQIEVNVQNLMTGSYYMILEGNSGTYSKNLMIASGK